MNKAQTREKVLKIRQNMLPAEVISAGIIIRDKLYRTEAYIKADTVLIYVSYNNEVDTHAIIEDAINSNKKVAVCKVISKGIMNFYYIKSLNELKKGYMGILEPTLIDKDHEYINKDNDNCVIICPGVAFDYCLNRLGYGGGYYDRFLSINNLYKIALAFDCQILEHIETEEHDRKVDMIITDKHILTKNESLL